MQKNSLKLFSTLKLAYNFCFVKMLYRIDLILISIIILH